jgi:hypothetical protein
MNTRTVDVRTMLAVLAMEAALAFPIMSLPTQGDRPTGLAGPFLLLLLLPGGFAGVYTVRSLRDPSWRLLAGIGLALLTRAIVSEVPEEGLHGITTWLGRSVVPAAIGVGLWWRGGALAVAEMTPAEVRGEFSVIAVCLVVTLAMIRPFLLPDRVLLGGSVGLFVVAGLVGTVLSRQDAAEVASPRVGRPLAAIAGLTPAAAAVLLVGSLRPELLSTMWLMLARGIELLLAPLGWFFAWLSSLFPRAAPGPPPTPPPLPTQEAINPAALAEAQERLAWIGTVIAIALLVAAAIALLIAARILLANVIREPRKISDDDETVEIVAEASGTPGEDAIDLFGWLMSWLRRRLRRQGVAQTQRPTLDAWFVYQRLLRWADSQGLGRRPAETTGQFSYRLAQHVPEAAEVVALVTQTFEWERYGSIQPRIDHLQSAREALDTLK